MVTVAPKKTCSVFSRRSRIDDLRQIEAPGQEADAPVDLAQPPLAIEVIGVLRAVAVAGSPLHDADHLRPLDAQQLLQFVADARVPARRDVVAGALRQAKRGVLLVFLAGRVAG
jgi:hypothetical protein